MRCKERMNYGIPLTNLDIHKEIWRVGFYESWINGVDGMKVGEPSALSATLIKFIDTFLGI